jgi:hypothetical protein
MTLNSNLAGFIMRLLTALGLISLSALMAVPSLAEAQTRRQVRTDGALILNVRPRSFLDPGTVVPVGSINRTTSGFDQARSNLVLPPAGLRLGEAVLPDPVTNGPFVGSRNPFGPVDFVAPAGLR